MPLLLTQILLTILLKISKITTMSSSIIFHMSNIILTSWLLKKFDRWKINAKKCKNPSKTLERWFKILLKKTLLMQRLALSTNIHSSRKRFLPSKRPQFDRSSQMLRKSLMHFIDKLLLKSSNARLDWPIELNMSPQKSKTLEIMQSKSLRIQHSSKLLMIWKSQWKKSMAR